MPKAAGACGWALPWAQGGTGRVASVAGSPGEGAAVSVAERGGASPSFDCISFHLSLKFDSHLLLPF